MNYNKGLWNRCQKRRTGDIQASRKLTWGEVRVPWFCWFNLSWPISGSCSSCPNFVHQEDFNNALKNCKTCTTSLTQCHFKCDICVKCKKCEMHMKNMHHHLPCLDRRRLAVGLPCLLACDRNMEHSNKGKSIQ